MSEVAIDDVDAVVYQAGSHDSLPIQVNGESFGVTALFDTTQHTDPSTRVTLEVFASTDGGLTFEFAGRVVRDGGPNVTPEGVELSYSGITTYHSITQKQKDGSLLSNVPRWVDPLFKTRLIVEGGVLTTKLPPVLSQARRAPSEPVHQSIAVVQSVSAFSPGTAISITSGNLTTTAGNLLIANTIAAKVTATFVSVTDSKSNTWTNSKTQTSGDNVREIRQYYAESCLGGATHNFTHTASSATTYFPDIVVSEVSGYAASALDKTASATDTTGTSHSTGSTATTAQANELLIACGYGATTGTETFTGAGGGWNTIVNSPNNSNAGGVVESQVVTGGPATYSWTFGSSGNITSVQFITTWKELSTAKNSLFRQSLLNGLGSGGPFFHNPIGRIMHTLRSWIRRAYA